MILPITVETLGEILRDLHRPARLTHGDLATAAGYTGWKRTRTCLTWRPRAGVTISANE